MKPYFFLFGLLLFFSVFKSQSIENENLKIAISNSGKPAYYGRALAITKISRSLSIADINNVYIFLDKKGNDGLTPLEINSLKNDLVLVLMRQVNPAPNLVEHLCSMYFDKEHSLIWRDYCIQFLGRLYLSAPLDDKKRITDTLKLALEDEQVSLVGAALIAINLNRDSAIVSRELLEKKILMILHSSAPDFVKASVLQVGVMNRIQVELLREFARKVLTGNGASIQLKMSALSALGVSGTASDLKLLQQYSASSDIRLQHAALNAIKKQR